MIHFATKLVNNVKREKRKTKLFDEMDKKNASPIAGGRTCM